MSHAHYGQQLQQQRRDLQQEYEKQVREAQASSGMLGMGPAPQGMIGVASPQRLSVQEALEALSIQLDHATQLTLDLAKRLQPVLDCELIIAQAPDQGPLIGGSMIACNVINAHERVAVITSTLCELMVRLQV